MISKTLPEIPATPGLPDSVPDSLPPFLSAKGKLGKLAAEFARLAGQYHNRAAAHREIANPAALNVAVADDDLAHAQAVRAGEDDPGPLNVTAWTEAEEVARRGVAGSRDALKLVWADLVAELADPAAGGELVAAIIARRDDARTRLAAAVETVRATMAELDVADGQARFAEQARTFALAQGNNGQRPDGMTARWPSGAPVGSPQPLVMNGRPEPVENVLHQLAAYRQR